MNYDSLRTLTQRQRQSLETLQSQRIQSVMKAEQLRETATHLKIVLLDLQTLYAIDTNDLRAQRAMTQLEGLKQSLEEGHRAVNARIVDCDDKVAEIFKTAIAKLQQGEAERIVTAMSVPRSLPLG